MKWEMEIMSPVSYHSESNWFLEESRSRRWTPEENKMFENALAYYDKETPDRWQKVAAMIPGKTVGDVMKQYKELEDDVSSIEAGLVPIPGYSTSPFTLDWGTSHGFDGFKPSYASAGKRSSAGRPSEQERKKGIPWTEEEHKLFLLGLKKYGKGDWRNISRNFVVTRTPTQVASHAQKYFIRQLSGGKDKRRASIHDITTVNLNDADQTLSSPDSQRPSPDSGSVQQTPFGQWNQQNGGAAMALNPRNGNMFVATYGLNSKLQAQSMQRSAMQESYFQMQSAHNNYPHGFADA